MLFATLAATGGSPAHSSTGKVKSVPEPTTVFMTPAPIPAKTIIAHSVHVIEPPYSKAGGFPAMLRCSPALHCC